ncbi:MULTISPECIES: alanine racemase [unclassified Agarivorans]|uniref:alanine racemase n=1 Tax=unclassified Agarivorans TaxID=2636026 RepID=UPI0026E2D858|nr:MULTISPECIES: alanine racemase [unclassified Agarivorans]MDO6686959.1 alanine racemase [Agarivorans sp. 3_MG-2023]MDO6716756.1 alanine racemase [Agarivorans sp. 2_MG-2023]
MNIANALVSLSALRHNFSVLKQRAPNSKILVVIKANAYGHGMLEVAQGLADIADGFAVARTKEALALRQAGIVAPILALEGFFDSQEAQSLAEHNIATVIHSEQQLALIEPLKLAKPLDTWVKLDTGMHRLGLLPEQFKALLPRLKSCTNIQANLKLISHFACADDVEHPLTPQQIKCFETLKAELNAECSLANSAGVLLWPQAHSDWNRPGISLYGISPQNHNSGADFGLIPAMTLQSNLIAVREHPQGESVGYGATWHAEQNTKLGVVAMGYGDGYPRSAPNGTPVWLNGRIVPIVGRVSMDMLCVDLGIDSQDQVGDRVVLWGPELPAERIAEAVDTIAYELVTKLTSRVRLSYTQ